jgi:site-specific DNA-methyltransferase (adenine-specific)
MNKFLYNVIWLGSYEEFMSDIPNKSIQLILIDPPYGTTPASWDCKINFEEMWKHFRRIIKDDGAIVITAQQPFTSLLIASNLKEYKYNWIWEKDNGTNFLNSKFQPLKITEDICIFSRGASSFVKNGITMKYNPQFTEGKPYTIKSGQQKSNSAVVRGGKGGREDVGGFKTVSNGKRYPKNLIKFNRDKEKLHPTQKPVGLMEYLIKTYSDEGDIVLDCFAGSGTVGKACQNTNRNFILIEKEKQYVDIISKRLN